MPEVSQQMFLGNDQVFGFYDNKWTGINSYELANAGWSFRTDAFSGSLSFATPGTLITEFGMSNAWSDVSANIRGTGSNLAVLTANLTGSGAFNNFSADGYTQSSLVNTTGRFRSSDDTVFEFGAGNFTIECWYNAAADTTPSRFIFSDYLVYNTPQCQLFFDTRDGRLRVALGISSTEIFNQTAVLTWVANQWYHIAFVRNGNVYTVYRDGVSVLSYTQSGTLNATTQNKFLMGFYNAGGDATYVQDYRIYKGIAKYTAAFTPPPSMAVFG